MLSLLNLITLIGAVQGIFFGLVLFGLQRGNRPANVWLAVFLLFFSIGMLGAVAYTSRWILEVPWLGMWHTPFAAVAGAPFLLYILAATSPAFRFRVRYGWLFVPFLVVALLQIPYLQMSTAEKRDYLEASYGGFPLLWKVSFFVSALANFICLAVAYVAVLRHERRIKEVYSSPLHKSMLWTRHFLYAGLATFIFCVLVSFVNIAWADPLSNLLFSVTMYVFAYRAIRQPEIFNDIRPDTLPAEESISLVHRGPRYEKSGLSETRARPLLEKLEQAMATEKMHLDPLLNLQQLADHLGAPPHQVSQLLNQFRNESFSDFVNRHRVEYFKQQIADPANAHLSILAVALDAGFNSKAAFNAAFKKQTGQTPSAYKESLGS